MINHVIQRDGQCRLVTSHHIRCAVSDEYHVDTGLIDDGRHGVIVGREHGDGFAIGFHFRKHLGGDAFGRLMNGHEFH